MIIWGKKAGRRLHNLWYEVSAYTQHSWPWSLPPTTSTSVEKPRARCVSFAKGTCLGKPHLLSLEGQAGHIPQQLQGSVSPRLTPTISPQSSHIEGPARGAAPLWGLRVFTEESQSLPHPEWGAQGWGVTTLSVYNDLILSDLKFGSLMQSSKQVTSTVTKKEGTIPQP